MSSVLTEFIGLLVGGISEMAKGIGSGLKEAVTEMFLTTDSTTHAITGLSTFGGLVGIFGGIALAVGFTTLIFNWLSNIGK